MLEKLKSFGEAAKSVVLYILVPVLAVVGYILYLLGKNKKLNEEIRVKTEEGKLNVLQGEQVDIDTSANDAVDEYERVRRSYLRSGSEPVRQSGTGSEEADPNKGPGDKPGPDAA